MRYIKCTVKNEFVSGAGQVIGAAGSHHDVALRIAFGEMWDGLSMYVTFRDALGENPTVVQILPSSLVLGTERTYDVVVPAAPKAKQGKAMVTVQGYTVVNGTQEANATNTATAYFIVLPSDYAVADDESIDATIAQQLQSEIDEIRETVTDARLAAKDAEAWAVGQIEGADVPETDGRYENNSKYYAQRADESATEAYGSASAAFGSASSASGSATAAATSETNAAASADNAAGSASAASSSASAAATSASTANQKALDAEDSAEDSEAWAVGQRGGTDVPSTDETYHNNAKYWAGQAQQAVAAHNTDASAHANLYIRAGQKSGTTLGTNATAEGNNTTASGNNSHAEGYSTTASGTRSHAEGGSTEASGYSSHAEGFGTTAQRKSQHVFGEYNVPDTTGSTTTRGQYVEIVGNGETSSARSNARTLDWSGNETLAGKLTLGAAPTADMDAATKQYVDSAIGNAIGGAY